MHEISDVATDPLSVFTPGRGGRTIVTGTRDGVDIRVILGNQKEGGGIITGFPSNIPRNP
jgi:filamentous hemagglutinin